MRLKIATLLLCLFSPALAQEASDAPSAVDIAKDYLAAYSTFDTDKMAPFYADDAVFTDPTSADQGANGEPFQFTGKDAILKGLGDYAAQYKSFSVAYDVERQYESEGVVVFVATLTWSVTGGDNQNASGSAPIVTAITVKDGKVTKHLDLYDYKGNAVDFPPTSALP